MKRGTWRTKEDVLKDLSLATGRKVADVGDEFLVVGEQPPPSRLVGDDDYEIELQFGRATAQRRDQCDAPGSDLKGITKMLRMVEGCENSDEGVKTEPGSKIVISKLNPNVREFIPKCVRNSPSQNGTKCEDIKITNAVNDMIVTSGSNVEKMDTKTTEIINVEFNRKIDSPEAKDHSKDAKKEMAAMLKNQISSKRHTFEEQRQTNLAIVNLLKLYAKSDPKDTVKPIKLYTPEFFEKCKASEFESNDETTIAYDVHASNIDMSNKQLQNVLAVKSKDGYENDVTSEFLMKGCKTDNFIQNKQNVEVDDLNEATSLTPDMADTSINDKKLIPTMVDQSVDREVAKSISKVSNWLDNKPYITLCEKEKPKGPALYLGTVAYKRKDPVTCKSPSEIADKKISKPSDRSYQPSSYADELLQKYKEKSEKIAPKLNIWEKLDQDLKKKDSEIKNRKSKP